MHEVNTLPGGIHSVFLVGWGLIFFRHFSARLRHRLLRSGSVSFSAMPSHWLTNPKYSLSLSSIRRVSRPDNSTTGFTFN